MTADVTDPRFRDQLAEALVKLWADDVEEDVETVQSIPGIDSTLTAYLDALLPLIAAEVEARVQAAAMPASPAEEAVKRVEVLHTAGAHGMCGGCGWTFPCPTRAALVGQHTTDEEAVVKRVEALHRPMVNTPGRVPACPDCLGGIHADDPDEARSCGCWGLSAPVCSSCADRDGPRLHPAQWPCPTAAALASPAPAPHAEEPCSAPSYGANTPCVLPDGHAGGCLR
jgi:hypothetical protein